MDTKRKANGTAGSELEDRNLKRRKLAEYDLSQGETRDSTTAHGLGFLEQIRRTQDKSGRLVATYFEQLPPRKGNLDYYEKTRMPISLAKIEQRLHNRDFQNLTELESYFKRMIANAKDYFPRTSASFDDAERIRKAVSNYMVKTNPAYQDRSYSAFPTPFSTDGIDGDSVDEENPVEQSQHADADPDTDGDVDAEGEEDQDNDAHDPDAGDEVDDAEPTSKRKSIIIKRRSSGRPIRNSISAAPETPKATLPPAKQDHQYEDVPYNGLDFQQAQEKIIEEMVRHQEPEYDDAYFEPFMNLPPRALKDYYKVIKDPLSLKKLQKLVKGIQGRHEATGVTEFKTWAIFEEKTRLLWDNAYYYNEEGSDIFSIAQDLEKFFQKQFKLAQAAVQEPAQPKIKLKVGQPAEPATTAKKITIHVGGRGGSVESPAPQVTEPLVVTLNGTAKPPLPLTVEKARSVSLAVSPSPSRQAAPHPEESVSVLPGTPSSRPTSSVSAVPNNVGAGAPPTDNVVPVPPPPVLPPVLPPVQILEPKRFRPENRGVESALISRITVQTHPHAQSSDPFKAIILPDQYETQTTATVNIPPGHSRICVAPYLPQFLNERQYGLWALMDKQPLKQAVHPLPGQLSQERVFEVLLHPGVNVLELHVVAAIPQEDRAPEGPEVEIEIITVLANVLKS